WLTRVSGSWWIVTATADSRRFLGRRMRRRHSVAAVMITKRYWQRTPIGDRETALRLGAATAVGAARGVGARGIQGPRRRLAGEVAGHAVQDRARQLRLVPRVVELALLGR